MNTQLTIEERNNVLKLMSKLVKQEKDTILKANKLDIDSYSGEDMAMYDRLKVNDDKIQGMIDSLDQLASQEDPLGHERFNFTHDNGLKISNKTAPFGTVMIIYESRPDVTIEAAGIAFKSGNKILLKGGKESLNSNLALVNLWHKALTETGVSTDWVEYLQYSRQEIQDFLKNPTQKVDLIIPRGGERLIEFVKVNSVCPVIVSGRGNNFVYVHPEADQELAIDIIVNAKTSRISVCNALDKVVIDSRLSDAEGFVSKLIDRLLEFDVEIIVDDVLKHHKNVKPLTDDNIWYEEFLDYKIVIGTVADENEAISKINKYSGGHSASIVTKNEDIAEQFLNNVDCAAVYHNASTRFTDGFQFGLGGELAISTDKLHQRGPIGLQHLVTNKWYVHGNGQIR